MLFKPTYASATLASTTSTPSIPLIESYLHKNLSITLLEATAKTLWKPPTKSKIPIPLEPANGYREI